MSQIERELAKEADTAILNASPEFLKLIQKFDIENQLTGDSFYEIYSTVLKSKNQKNRILPETK